MFRQFFSIIQNNKAIILHFNCTELTIIASKIWLHHYSTIKRKIAPMVAIENVRSWIISIIRMLIQFRVPRIISANKLAAQNVFYSDGTWIVNVSTCFWAFMFRERQEKLYSENSFKLVNLNFDHFYWNSKRTYIW